MTMELRAMVTEERKTSPEARLTRVLDGLGLAGSSWYARPKPAAERKRPGPAPQPVPPEVELWVLSTAQACPWWGYKRIAVVCRRAGHAVSNRQAYKVFKKHGLFHRPRPHDAELYQAARLFELLPNGPNDLWQMDVTYIHIAGYGWWYAVTVIDYYSRYLLALRLTWSYSAAEVIEALDAARAKAESIHGPLARQPFLVTDNGSSFIARRFAAYVREDFTHVRIQYRTPTQLGLLERFHETLKREEVYWRLYDDPQHARECLAEFERRYNYDRPHWALVPEAGGDPLVPAEVYVEGWKTQLPKWQAWAREVRRRLDEMQVDAA